MKTQFDRRQFMQRAAALGAGAYTLDSKLLAAEQSPNERLNIACIGVGGKGDSDTEYASHYGNVVALCDIDDNMLNKKAAKFSQARKFHDFRQMLDEMQDQIDVVTVSTPDHTHAVASMMAIKLKKHVYTQKPLTWSVFEARALREAANQYGVCTQMGNQGQASDGSRTSIEIIRSGVLGDVQTVHTWTDRCGKWWKQAPDLIARPADTPAVPSYVHWDLFLGPAPPRPYHPAYHPFMWRGWRDFGTGALGDMACHIMNVPYMGLNLQSPTWVTAESSEINLETYQQWATITYQFAAGEGHGPIQLHWWEGRRNGKRNLPPAELLQGAPVED
ncbi:MAG: Gfo/Idh/MocA family oxidoreductase, partial [Planctomycetales bacterium]|nr:Gfo/Idh/MocA family oxidoreductase [Planctomycetales bacterium]